MTAPSVEIVIINWNGRDHTLACLEAVEPQLADVPGAVVTVVDNGSTDDSARAVAVRHPSAKLYVLDTNRGFTGGIAASVEGSTARNIVFLNNDAVPETGWLRALFDAIERAPDDVVSVGGKIVDPAGKLIDFIGGMLTFDGHAFQNGFRYPLGSREEPAQDAEILFACGGNMISRLEPLRRLGGFDDDYFAYLEDVDFGWRTWLSGGRVLFEPRALVRHASSATSNRLGDFERGVLFERNAMQTAIKNFEDLHDAAGAMFLASLHRLHHYATWRNLTAEELRRAPFSGSASSRREGLLSRIRAKILGPRPLAVIDDPLTAMQFRALHWVLEHGSRIAGKRSTVQRLRTRTDAEIFTKFPLHAVPTYPGDDELFANPLFDLLRPALPLVEKPLGEIMKS